MPLKRRIAQLAETRLGTDVGPKRRAAADVVGLMCDTLGQRVEPTCLPIDTMFGTRLGGEGLLLRLAAQLESARPWAGRRPPL